MASRDGSDQHASTRPRAHLRRAVDVRDSCFGGPNRLGAWSPPSRAGTPPRRCCNRSLERTARRQLSCGICCHMTIHLGESVDMRANPDLNGSAACSPLLFPTIALSLCHECATWSCPRWLVFYGCFAGRGDRLEASERVTWVAVTREFVGLL